MTVIALMTLAQFFYGMAFAASPALYADTVVYATWKSGKDASGWIMGLQNLPLKIAVFLRGTILSACLVAVGMKSGVVLEGTARPGNDDFLCTCSSYFLSGRSSASRVWI